MKGKRGGRRSNKRASKKPRRAMRRRAMRRGIREYAACQYSTLSAPLFPNANVYAFRNFSLASASARVVDIGGSYQFYRIKRITWQVRPAYDTFAPATPVAGGPGTTVPQLYWRIDRDANFAANTTLEVLKGSGCKPIRLDDRNIVKSFKPSVLQAVAESAGKPAAGQLVMGTSRISPWLPTNNDAFTGVGQGWLPSSVDHNGLLISIDQDSAPLAQNTPCAYISFTVEYEFKKPLEYSSSGDTEIVDVKLETLAPGYVPPAEANKV